MKKKIGDFTIRQMANECIKHEYCEKDNQCPFSEFCFLFNFHSTQKIIEKEVDVPDKESIKNDELPKIKGYCKDCKFKGFSYTSRYDDNCTLNLFYSPKVKDEDYCSKFEPKKKKQ